MIAAEAVQAARATAYRDAAVWLTERDGEALLEELVANARKRGVPTLVRKATLAKALAAYKQAYAHAAVIRDAGRSGKPLSIVRVADEPVSPEEALVLSDDDGRALVTLTCQYAGTAPAHHTVTITSR